MPSNEDKQQEPIWIAAVEGGGTSFRVAICQIAATAGVESSTPPPTSTLVHRTEIDSDHAQPHETLAACVDFLTLHKPTNGYAALGIATFGPVGVRPEDPETYGRILASSPKAPWRNVDVVTPLQQACQGSRPLVVRVETDVNAPALAEYYQAKQQNNSLSSTAYITVGTGVGVGLVVNGAAVHGRMHPEGGHVPVQPLPHDTFGGYSWGQDRCPFHGKNTVEGIASSVALTERLEQIQPPDGWQQLSRTVLATLPDNHPVWEHAANALANLCATLLLTLSVERIVLGGGIMKREGLVKLIQDQTVKLLNGYLPLPSDMSTLITTSEAGNDAGLVGAIVLAEQGLREEEGSSSKDREKEMKRAAFGHGLWHGFLVGVVGTALVCKYCFMRPRRK